MHDGAIERPVDMNQLEKGRVAGDAIETVVALGYSRGEAKRWVEETLATQPGLETVEALTLAVLRRRDSG
jgi:Holliday junction resolvasome RuvABC DNA-binding subunit